MALAEQQRVPMDKLTLQELKGVDERFEDDVLNVFDYEASVEKRTVLGGTSRKSCLEQIERLEETVR